MVELEINPLSPASKDPAEGARRPGSDSHAQGPLNESHLGDAGDPVEGKPDEPELDR